MIGQLWREDRGDFCFSYASGLGEAETQGFVRPPEFPDERAAESPYRSRHLFATFAQRIPSPRRPDFQQMLRSWGVDSVDDPLAILAASGGILMTDGIELAEYRAVGDELDRPLKFRLAGKKFHPPSDDLREGDRLVLRREPENPCDPNATIVAMRGDVRVGYVPRQYSPLVARLLDRGCQVDAVAVRRLELPAKEGRWVIEISRRPSSH